MKAKTRNKIELEGRHEYNVPRKIPADKTQFSVNIYRLLLSANGKFLKASPCLVRVFGPPERRRAVIAMCDDIVSRLDAGTWDGRETVFVK